MDIKINSMPYLYYLYTWGGFYNKEFQDIHGYIGGGRNFNTAKEREEYLDTLKQVEIKLNARHLAFRTCEGFNTLVPTILHRVVEYKGNQYYSNNDMGIGYPYGAAEYHMQWKWYPGFNDYPLGEDFDYDKEKFTIIQEWITGSFSQTSK